MVDNGDKWDCEPLYNKLQLFKLLVIIFNTMVCFEFANLNHKYNDEDQTLCFYVFKIYGFPVYLGIKIT